MQREMNHHYGVAAHMIHRDIVTRSTKTVMFVGPPCRSHQDLQISGTIFVAIRKVPSTYERITTDDNRRCLLRVSTCFFQDSWRVNGDKNILLVFDRSLSLTDKFSRWANKHGWLRSTNQCIYKTHQIFPVYDNTNKRHVDGCWSCYYVRWISLSIVVILNDISFSLDNEE